MLHRTFNSLSRDHWQVHSDHHHIRNSFKLLSTPSLGITRNSEVARTRTVGLAFNSLSRDHYIYRSSSALPSARSNFQLPLSGSRSRRESSRPSRVTSLSTPSLGITSSRIRKSPQLRSSSFQLPLSGSPSRLRARRSGCGMPRLSTPSLGITGITAVIRDRHIYLFNFQLPLSGSQ